ncbi:MAG TPA: glucosaminidase domain-containing protein [Paenibacillus sp.]|uniref:glucosaminidase domain-containing protein n=1 Tax=Paenibacillus sp. TaxID=58172 RepID=UPI0028D2C27A|nr:glucosaminidase domain-containing protein [Paenibacillus sp.]HUC93305.1 glucosaminidase domain-containing protein [Paenibacillus sp.]
MNREQFVAALAPLAIRARSEGSPFFPSVRLAQNLLETGGVIHPWNNLGGIKVGDGRRTPYWRGRAVNKRTWEVYDGERVDVSADFRAYDSVYDYYKDQDLLMQRPRYERVRLAATPEEQARALQATGYATDPRYADKLIELIRAYDLKRFDEPVRPPQDEPLTVTVEVNGEDVGKGFVVDGQTWGPARLVGTRLGAQIGWNGQEVTVNGTVQPTLVIDRTGYVPLRALAESLGARVHWDGDRRTVRIDI